MGLYKQFLQSSIDFSPLGLHKGDARSDYFCTPKGAKIIGWAGVDGIHYCFLKNFGEMVFAVSPMSCPGEYVHPIAASVKDLLMLLLSCGSFDCLEQAWSWKRETFEDYLADYPPTSEQQAVLDAIREEFGVGPVEDAYGYLKQIAADFDYSRIRYTQEYYELVPDAPPPPWEVTFRGGFWGSDGKAGKEIPIGKEFPWGGRRWKVPAVYACGEGIVVDFCIRVEPEKIRVFWEKWYGYLKENLDPPRDIRNRIEADNPLEMPHFHPELTINGVQLRSEGGCGTRWMPRGLLPEELESGTETEDLIRHYGLDENFGWIFHRARFPWEEAVDIYTLELRLKAFPETFYGPSFSTPEIGGQVELTHPVTGTVHTLTVRDIQRGSFEKDIPMEGVQEWPRQYLSMEYTLSPDLENHSFTLRETAESDAPRLKAKYAHPSGAASIGIIGGADGPTAIIFSHHPGPHPHGAVSSLHFDPPENVIWQPEFREKLTEDITVTLK